MNTAGPAVDLSGILDDPKTWAQVFFSAVERGDERLATMSHAELVRLGWLVTALTDQEPPAETPDEEPAESLNPSED